MKTKTVPFKVEVKPDDPKNPKYKPFAFRLALESKFDISYPGEELIDNNIPRYND